MLENELNALDAVIEAHAMRREYAHATARLIIREHKEPAEEREHNENEDKVSHGV